MKTILPIILAGLVFGAATAEAGRNDKREVRQQNRISKGVENGSLNEREAKRLKRGQQRIDQAQDQAAADGDITKKEKAKLEKMQDVQSKRIYRQKHDGQDAPEQKPEQ